MGNGCESITPCKAALSQEVVQLHQMPLASEPKHFRNFSLIFHPLLLKHRGVLGGCTTEEDNKPTFCLPKNTVCLSPCVLTYKEASIWLRDSDLHSCQVTKGPG